jgi:hypothetical protein
MPTIFGDRRDACAHLPRSRAVLQRQPTGKVPTLWLDVVSGAGASSRGGAGRHSGPLQRTD